nr:MAG TPA: tail tape measure protein [Caudoviricetes sp.]
MKLFDIYGRLKIKGLSETKKGLNEVGESAKSTGSLFERIIDRVTNATAKLWDKIRGNGKKASEGLGKDFEKSSRKITSEIEKLNNLKILVGGKTGAKLNLKTFDASVKAIKQEISALDKVKIKPGIDTSVVNQRLSELKANLRDLQSSKYKVSGRNIIDPKVFDSAISSIKRTNNSLRELGGTGNSASSRLKSAFHSISNGAKSMGSAVKGTVNGLKSAFSSLKSSITGIPGMLASVGVALGTKAVFDYSKNLDQARINWEVLMGSAEKGQEMLSRIQKFVKDTPFDFNSTQKFAQQLKIAGLNGDQLFKTMQVIGDSAQGNVEKAEGIATAYQQMSAKGKIQTEEMNQLLERGIPAWDMLAKATGKSKAELMQMASQGKLMADEYLPKLVDQMDKTFGGGMQKQAQTFNGQLDQLEDNLLMIGSRGVAPLRQALTGLMKDVNDVFDGKLSVTEMLGKWGRQFKEGLTKLGENIANFDLGSVVKKLLKGLEIGSGFISDVVKGFAKLVDGIFEFFKKTDWNGISKEINSKIVEGFKNFDLGGALAWIVNKIVDFAKTLVDHIKNADYSDMGATLGKLIREIISKVGDFIGEVSWGNIFSLIWSAFTGGLELVFVDLPVYIANLLSGLFLGMSLSEVADAIGGWFENIGNWVSEKWNAFIQWFSDTTSSIGGTVSKWWDYMVGGLSEWWKSLTQWISEKFDQLVGWFKDLPNKIAQFGIWIWQGITGSLGSMWSSVTSWFTEKFNQLVSWFRELPSKIAEFGSWIWSGITGSLGSMWSNATGWFNEKFNQLVSWFQEGANKVSSFGSWVWNSISGGLNSLWYSVTNIGSSIVEGVWNGIVSATGWFYSQVESFFSGLIDSAKSFLGINSPSKVFAKTVGHAIPEGVALGINQASDVAVGSVSELASKLQDSWQGDFDTNFNAYGNVNFDSETSNPFRLLNSKFDELTTAFANIEFKGVMNIDGEHFGEAIYSPLNNLIDEGGII